MKFLQVFLLTLVGVASAVDESEFVNPKGYPFTLIEYLKVLDSFLGGYDLYGDVDLSRECISDLQEQIPLFEYTFDVWNITAYQNKDDTTTTKFIYDEEFDIIVYNATQTISQQFAPVYSNCAQATYTYVSQVITHFQQFDSWNYFFLSLLENFLGSVFELNSYYNLYLEAVNINDVNVQLFRLGQIAGLLAKFDQIVLDTVDDPTTEWDSAPSLIVRSPMVASALEMSETEEFNDKLKPLAPIIPLLQRAVDSAKSKAEARNLAKNPIGPTNLSSPSSPSSSSSKEADEDNSLNSTSVSSENPLPYYISHPNLLIATQGTPSSTNFAAPRKHLVGPPDSGRNPPEVGVSFWTLSWEEYVSVGSNLLLGFFEKTLEIESVTVANCTQYTLTTITYFQQVQLHYEAQRWEQMVESSGQILYQVDPFAKACTPALYEVYVNSDEYGPSFESYRDRLHYNTIYRLGDVFINMYRVDASIKAFIERTYEYQEKTAIIFASQARECGQLFGNQFKMLFSVEEYTPDYADVDMKSGSNLIASIFENLSKSSSSQVGTESTTAELLYEFDEKKLYDSMVDMPNFDYMTFPNSSDMEQIYPEFKFEDDSLNT